ncbi:MAG: hypothetical protein QXD23_01390 [Candidatus Micrarchaeaceae archaeon]
MEISYTPRKKVIIHQIYHFKTPEDLIKFSTSGDGSRTLYWVNGILFIMYTFSSDKAKDQELEGIFNINYFDYAHLEKYKEIIEFEDNFFKLVKTRVVNYEHVPFFRDLIKWIKDNESKKLWD